MSKIYWNTNNKKVYIEYIINWNTDEKIDVQFIKKIPQIEIILNNILTILPTVLVDLINEYCQIIITVTCQCVIVGVSAKKIFFTILDSHNYFFDTYNKKINITYQYLLLTNTLFPLAKNMNNNYNDGVIQIAHNNIRMIDYINIYNLSKFINFYIKYHYNKKINEFINNNKINSGGIFNYEYAHNKYNITAINILNSRKKIEGQLTVLNHKIFKNIIVVLQLLIATLNKYTKKN